MDRSTKFASVVLALFGVPFCGFGLFALSTAFRPIANGGPGQTWFLVIFGAVFSLIGLGLLGAAVFGPRKIREANRRQAENPSEPWLWREDWSQGCAASQTKSSLITAWIFAILWNLVSAGPFLALKPQDITRQPKVLLVLIFPAMGIALLIWAVRETLRWLEFGKTYFVMASVPCVVGREFRGTIQARFPHAPDHGVRLKLTCVNHIVTGSGNTRSTEDKILWREEKSVSSGELYSGPMGTTIPVSFHVPVDARQTDTRNPRYAINWLLEADADVPGVDYKDVFEIPVFRTKDTPSAEPPERFANTEATTTNVPPHPTIIVRPAFDGGTEFYFPAARNKGFAAGLSLFSLLWGGFIWLMLTHHVPILFPVVFGLFESLIVFFVTQMWFGVSSVVVGSGSVRVRSGVFGLGKPREIPTAQIAAVQAAIGAQQGGGSSGTPYYDIQLVQPDGKKITLGRTVRDKQEGEWIAAEMERLIGLKSQRAMAAGAS